jgi:hypothetical protein
MPACIVDIAKSQPTTPKRAHSKTYPRIQATKVWEEYKEKCDKANEVYSFEEINIPPPEMNIVQRPAINSETTTGCTLNITDLQDVRKLNAQGMAVNDSVIDMLHQGTRKFNDTMPAIKGLKHVPSL